MHAGTYVGNMDMKNMLRLIGDGTGIAATNVGPTLFCMGITTPITSTEVNIYD